VTLQPAQEQKAGCVEVRKFTGLPGLVIGRLGNGEESDLLGIAAGSGVHFYSTSAA
jgi:hypothetical protein